MKRFFRTVGSLSRVSSSESSHLSSHHRVDAAGFDTAYLSTFFFLLKGRRLTYDPSLFLSNDTQLVVLVTYLLALVQQKQKWTFTTNKSLSWDSFSYIGMITSNCPDWYQRSLGSWIFAIAGGCFFLLCLCLCFHIGCTLILLHTLHLYAQCKKERVCLKKEVIFFLLACWIYLDNCSINYIV